MALAPTHSRASYRLGSTSVVIGIVALLTCWVPLITIPLSALGLLIGIVGILLAVGRRESGLGYPIGGAVLCFLVFMPTVISRFAAGRTGVPTPDYALLAAMASAKQWLEAGELTIAETTLEEALQDSKGNNAEDAQHLLSEIKEKKKDRAANNEYRHALELCSKGEFDAAQSALDKCLQSGGGTKRVHAVALSGALKLRCDPASRQDLLQKASDSELQQICDGKAPPSLDDVEDKATQEQARLALSQDARTELERRHDLRRKKELDGRRQLQAREEEKQRERERLLAKASANGKYSQLLAEFPVPEDRQRYGEFRDYGHFWETRYKGLERPAGYWVYVYPNWYIWRRQLEERSLAEEGKRETKPGSQAKPAARSSPPSRERGQSIPEKLATLDSGRPVAPNDAAVSKFDRVLKSLRKKCPGDDETSLGDKLVVSRNLLKNYGINITLLKLAESIDRALPEGYNSLTFQMWLAYSSSPTAPTQLRGQMWLRMT